MEDFTCTVEIKIKRKGGLVHTTRNDSLEGVSYLVSNHRSSYAYITIWFE